MILDEEYDYYLVEEDIDIEYYLALEEPSPVGDGDSHWD